MHAKLILRLAATKLYAQNKVYFDVLWIVDITDAKLLEQNRSVIFKVQCTANICRIKISLINKGAVHRDILKMHSDRNNITVRCT